MSSNAPGVEPIGTARIATVLIGSLSRSRRRGFLTVGLFSGRSAPQHLPQRIRHRILRRGEARVSRPSPSRGAARRPACCWHIRHELGQVARLRRQQMMGDLGDIAPAEGPRSAQQLVEHGAHRKQIAARIDIVAAALLGRHIGRRADDRAILCQFRGVEAGNAEIRHLHLAIRHQQDIRRFHVAVHDAQTVGRAQSIQYLRR